MFLGYHPKKVHSSGIIGECGTDTFNTIMLDYESDVTVHLATTIDSIIDSQAVIFGTKGHILLPEFSALQSFQVVLDDGTQYIKDFPFRINGFEYQINEVERCLKNQGVEGSVMTHQNTIDVMSLMDKIRSDWGLRFPCE